MVVLFMFLVLSSLLKLKLLLLDPFIHIYFATIVDRRTDHLVAVSILLLSQENSTLERNTQAFLDLCHLVHYDVDSLYLFFLEEAL